MCLPVSTSKMIMSYLEDFRPKISATASDWLFPNSRGERRNVVGFSHQISVLIDRHADLEMHVHLFRHFALKLLEEDDPNSVELGRRLAFPPVACRSE
jgi:site-specific recombinase XerD